MPIMVKWSICSALNFLYTSPVLKRKHKMLNQTQNPQSLTNKQTNTLNMNTHTQIYEHVYIYNGKCIRTLFCLFHSTGDVLNIVCILYSSKKTAQSHKINTVEYRMS